MLKMLEKLINEHGSAKILKERLGLKDDQIQSLKNEFSGLKSDNENLKISLDKANQEINRLKEAMLPTTESGSVNGIAETGKDILTKLFNTAEYITKDELCDIFSLEHGVIGYHVDFLIENEFLKVVQPYYNLPSGSGQSGLNL